MAAFKFYLLVLSKASLMAWNPSVLSSQAFTSAAWQAEGSLTTGPRVMLSAMIRLLAPPPSYGITGTGPRGTVHIITQWCCRKGLNRISHFPLWPTWVWSNVPIITCQCLPYLKTSLKLCWLNHNNLTLHCIHCVLIIQMYISSIYFLRGGICTYVLFNTNTLHPASQPRTSEIMQLCSTGFHLLSFTWKSLGRLLATVIVWFNILI